MNDINSIIKEAFLSCGLERFTGEETLSRFGRLYEMLIEKNRVMNLTAITEPRAVALLHFADSLCAEKYIKEGSSLLDVGCGGGFPTLPLALVRPDLGISALDSTAKKLTFVSEAAEKLSLNVKTIAGRAEEAGGDPAYREKFDAVTARAVASLPVLCELCLPFVKVGGSFVALKGRDSDAELEASGGAIAKLGGRLALHDRFTLADGSERGIIVIEKAAPTPKIYPRAYAKIKKSPLG